MATSTDIEGFEYALLPCRTRFEVCAGKAESLVHELVYHIEAAFAPDGLLYALQILE